MGEQTTYVAPAPPPPKKRPSGVTVLAILEFVGAALFLLAGIAMVALGPLIESMAAQMALQPLVPLLLGAVSAFLIAMGGLLLVIGWGLWTGRKWAWWLQVLISAFSAVSSLIGLLMLNLLELVPLAISALVLYYFFKPHVKEYFGVKVSSST